jgi:hypothetical protein
MLVAIVAASAPLITVQSQEWLTNGGFESGQREWSYTTGEPVNCPPRSGSFALGIRATDPNFALAVRNVFGSLPAGSYTLTGWAYRTSPSGVFKVGLSFLHDYGSRSGVTEPVRLDPGTSAYAPFTLVAVNARDTDTATLSIELDPEDIDAEVCIDDLQITSMDPTPTATPISGATETPTPVPTSTTPPPANATSTATTVPTPTTVATTAPSATTAPTYAFTNGGFEEGLEGWSKYGGTLSITASALNGGASGLLTSDTDSTKWAYQEVYVDPSQYYEFAGTVQADGGVSAAYLRVSWYTTSDASGSAIATTDSTQSSGPGDATYLTTGAIQPPAGAVTARVRVVLTPLGAGSASVRIDDVSFGVTAASTPTPTVPPSSTPIPSTTATPTPTGTFAPLGAAATTHTPSPEESPPPRANESNVRASAASSTDATKPAADTPSQTVMPFAQVASSRVITPLATSEALSRTIARPSQESSGLSWPWVLGISLLAFGLGGIVLQNRRSQR